jgi:hypothetical protein
MATDVVVSQVGIFVVSLSKWRIVEESVQKPIYEKRDASAIGPKSHDDIGLHGLKLRLCDIIDLPPFPYLSLVKTGQTSANQR